MPLVVSAPVVLAVTSLVYQPCAPSVPVAASAAVGGVASNLKVNMPVPMLPARSVQVPLTEAAALSVLYSTPPSQLPLPYSTLVPVKLIVAAWLYQPL